MLKPPLIVEIDVLRDIYFYATQYLSTGEFYDAEKLRQHIFEYQEKFEGKKCSVLLSAQLPVQSPPF